MRATGGAAMAAAAAAASGLTMAVAANPPHVVVLPTNACACSATVHQQWSVQWGRTITVYDDTGCMLAGQLPMYGVLCGAVAVTSRSVSHEPQR